MNLDELEESLAEFLPSGFQIEVNKHGQLIILTGLRKDDDGELVDFEPEEDEDLEFDPEFEPLEDEEDPDEDDK
jgi:hypothetical protein